MTPAIATLLRDLGIDASHTRLFRQLSARISPEMIVAMARTDYEMDLVQHQQALVHLVTLEEVPDPFERHPRKVIDLVRWLEPNAPGWSSGKTGEVGHVMRAFASTALLVAGGRASGRKHATGENVTVVQLVGSVLALGAAHALPAADLLCWRLDADMIDPGERPFFVLGLLVLLRLSAGFQVPPSAWAELAGWIVSEEASARAAAPPVVSRFWLRDLTGYAQKINVWRELARKAFIDRPAPGAEAFARHIAEWP